MTSLRSILFFSVIGLFIILFLYNIYFSLWYLVLLVSVFLICLVGYVSSVSYLFYNLQYRSFENWEAFVLSIPILVISIFYLIYFIQKPLTTFELILVNIFSAFILTVWMSIPAININTTYLTLFLFKFTKQSETVYINSFDSKTSIFVKISVLCIIYPTKSISKLKSFINQSSRELLILDISQNEVYVFSFESQRSFADFCTSQVGKQTELCPFCNQSGYCVKYSEIPLSRPYKNNICSECHNSFVNYSLKKDLITKKELVAHKI